MIEEIKKELEEKIKELEWKNNLRSLEMIEWIKGLLSKLEVKEEKKPEPKVVVEVKEVEPVEEKKVVKRKITFSKKK